MSIREDAIMMLLSGGGGSSEPDIAELDIEGNGIYNANDYKNVNGVAVLITDPLTEKPVDGFSPVLVNVKTNQWTFDNREDANALQNLVDPTGGEDPEGGSTEITTNGKWTGTASFAGYNEARTRAYIDISVDGAHTGTIEIYFSGWDISYIKNLWVNPENGDIEYDYMRGGTPYEMHGHNNARDYLKYDETATETSYTVSEK